MKCVSCDNPKELKERKTTVKYTDCGLDNVALQGVLQSKCEQCGEEYFGYGDIEGLHNAIAQVLITKKGALSGKEIRFLRALMGYSGAAFAKLIGIQAETQSRYENDKLPIPQYYDLLIRSLAENKLPDRNYDLHDHFLNQSGRDIKIIELCARDNGWEYGAQKKAAR